MAEFFDTSVRNGIDINGGVKYWDSKSGDPGFDGKNISLASGFSVEAARVYFFVKSPGQAWGSPRANTDVFFSNINSITRVP